MVVDRDRLIAAALAASLVGLGAWLAWPTPYGRYQIAAQPGQSWRIDTVTGHVSVCRGASMAEPPLCSLFGAQSLETYRRQSKPEAAVRQTTPSDIDALLQADRERPPGAN